MREILDLDSGSAATIFSFIKIQRENPNEELGMVELENSLSQAIWRMFDNLRDEISNKLGVDGADLLLTDARVIGVKIDGNQIINPNGFTGKEIEILLALTMVRRDKFVEGRDLFEGGSVRAYLTAKKEGVGEALYVEVDEDKTSVFHIRDSGISHLDGFDWGVSRVLDSIKEELGVMPVAARGIYSRHAGGVVSEHVSKNLDRIFYNAFSEFVDGLKGIVKDSVGSNLPSIYLHTFFSVPEGLHRKRFAFGGKRLSLKPSVVDSDISIFAGDDAHTRYEELNQLAKRRIKWLMPTI